MGTISFGGRIKDNKETLDAEKPNPLKPLTVEANKIIPQKIVNREKIAYQAPEARCFFSQNRKKKEYDLTKKFLSSAKKIDILNYKNVTNLIEKIKDPLSSQRLGFRENMAFVLGMSFYCLEEFSKKYKNKIS